MVYITVNFVSQKSFKFATTSEVLKMDRITSVIEQHPNFSTDKSYDIFFIGCIAPIRHTFVSKFTGSWASELGNAPLVNNRRFSDSLTFYWNDIKVNNTYTFYDAQKYGTSYENYNPKVLPILKSHINELKPWPSRDCVAIDGDLIIIVLDDESLNQIKEQL